MAVAAGPTNSVVVDKQGLYYMAGKVRLRPRSFHLFGNLILGESLVEEQWRGWVKATRMGFVKSRH